MTPENDRGRALEDAAPQMEKANAPESFTGRTIGGDEGSRVERDSNFGPVPVAAADALAAGRFPSGLKGFGVLAYLHCRGWRDGVVETTIAKLIEAVEWEHTPRALRMLLESLRSGGYIVALGSDRSGTWRIEVPTRNRVASDRPKRKRARDAGLPRATESELPTSFRPPSDVEGAPSDLDPSQSAQEAGSRPFPSNKLPISTAVCLTKTTRARRAPPTRPRMETTRGGSPPSPDRPSTDRLQRAAVKRLRPAPPALHVATEVA